MFIETTIFRNGMTTSATIKVENIDAIYPDVESGRPNHTYIITNRSNFLSTEDLATLTRKIRAAMPLTTEITPDEI